MVMLCSFPRGISDYVAARAAWMTQARDDCRRRGEVFIVHARGRDVFGNSGSALGRNLHGRNGQQVVGIYGCVQRGLVEQRLAATSAALNMKSSKLICMSP